MSLRPGSSLGPCTVTSKLGEGGMGEVYRARDQRLNRDVALKVLPLAFANDGLQSAAELRFDDLQAVTVPNAPGEIVGYDVASDGTSVLVGRIEDPPILRREIRTWPGWGRTLPSMR